jgi:phage terminase small subunit
MRGRPGKPVNLLMMEGRKHLTKSEIEARTQQEQGLQSGNKRFKPNEKVMQNETALKTFKQLKKLYKDIDYVEGLDENVINRYCLMTAEVDTLEELLSRMHDDLDECDEAKDRIQLYKTIAGAEITVNRVRDMLLKIEDRLFLNPTSRVKNVPHKEQPKPQSEFEKNFGDI